MKRLITFLTIAIIASTVGIYAQDPATTGTPKATYPILEKKLTKSDEDAIDPKKNVKTKFWFSRADLMMDIYYVNLQYLARGVDQVTIDLMFGDAEKTEQVTKDGKACEKRYYEKVNVVLCDGSVEDWEETNMIHENPLPLALEALQKVEGMVEDDDEKSKKKIKEEYDRLKALLDRQGIECYVNENFKCAYESFVLMTKVNESALYEGAIDTAAFYNAAMSASKASMVDESIEYYELARKYNYPEPSMYVFLKQKYYEMGDTTKGVEVLKDGFSKHSDNQAIIREFINYYLGIQKADEALEYIKLAQEGAPDDVSLFFVEGTIYDKLENSEKALEAYKKCIDIDPNYFLAQFNVGVVYYNNASKKFEEVNNIPTNEPEKYDAALKEAEAELAKALPYMEKSHEIAPDDADVLRTLKTLYYRLKMEDKLKEVQEKLDALEG